MMSIVARENIRSSTTHTMNHLSSNCQLMECEEEKVQNILPQVQNILPVQSMLPQIQNTSLQIQNTVPQIQNALPQVQNALSQVQTSLPQVQNALPQVQNALPQVQNALPQVQNALPQVQNALPKVQNAIPQVQNALSQVQNALPPVQNALGPVQNALPQVQNSLQVHNSLQVQNSLQAQNSLQVQNSLQTQNSLQVQNSLQAQNSPDKNILSALMQVLRKYKLKDTELALQREANISPEIVTTSSETDMSKVLSAYKSEGDPALYKDAYQDLIKFVENSLDIYKHELGTILYPVFVHMYLELVYNGYEREAIDFMKTFGPVQEPYYQDDIKKFSSATKKDHMMGNELTETFKNNTFTIRMSRDTVSLLKRHMKEKDCSILLDIIKQHMYFDMYEGVARNKTQIEITAGGFAGEARREDNKAKVYYGLLKEPDLQAFFPAEDVEEECPEGDKPKKKKTKKDPLLNRKVKTDPNAPVSDRMPLPELKDVEKLEKVKAIRESSKRVTLGADALPSVCCYTILNSNNTITSAEICEDGSILAAGFADSRIKLWSLTPQKLRAMKSAEQLQDINIEADDVLARIMEDRSGESVRTLRGHCGPVYRLSFSPDRTLLLSASEDGSIRLWSLLVWTCLVAYKGHIYPVWDVEFSPHGYYFVTGSHDKTARLWTTDNHQPIRIFTGHYADVDCVKFHPNSNYIATGSSDRTVRLWDCVSGAQVRLMTGHKGAITALCFSMEGRFLTSAGTEGTILVWDLAHGHLLAVFSGHTSMIYSLAFSRDGNILASGSHDFTVKLWDFTKFTEDVSFEDINVCHNPDIKKNSDSYLLRTFRTKESPVINLFFTRRNVLFTVCSFES